ncbi:hypothetical protein [Microvirga terrestris]|nr:hypothetical protein [Microvirga terrestris]
MTGTLYIEGNKALNAGYYDTKPAVFERLLETTGTLIWGRSVS